MPDHSEQELRQLQATSHYRELLRDYVEVFTTPQGARVLEDLRGRCYVDRTTLTRPNLSGPVDVHHTIWCEGARAVYLGILERVDKGQRTRAPQQTHAVGTLVAEAVKLVD
jgi:hypothetical protein